MEVYQQGRGRMGKGTGNRSINGRYRIDRGMLIVQEMEKPENLHA